MGRKAYFVESKLEVYDYAICDKCGLNIKRTTPMGRDLKKCFWNPNPRAMDRNICELCHDVWSKNKAEKWRLWQEKGAEAEHVAQQETKPA